MRANYRNWLLPVILLVSINFLYFYPVFQGKTLMQDDIIMAKAKGKEIADYRKSHDEEPLWTNAMFSGMPTFQMSTLYPNNWLSKFHKITSWVLVRSSSIYIIATTMIGFFFLLRVHKVDPWLSVAGAISVGFSAFFIISLAAGHNSKLLTAAYMAPALMGILLTLKGKHLLGFALTALFLGMNIRSNHFQITFYLAHIVIVILLAYGIQAYREKKIPQFLKRAVILLAAALLAIGPNIGNLWSTYAYTQETMRGGNDLLREQAALEGEKDGSAKSGDGEGLTYEYSMSWSMTRAETFSLFMPVFAGGGSKEDYSNTDLYNRLMPPGQGNNPQVKNQVNNLLGSTLYWGESMTNGAYYLGSVVIFLFVLGLVLIKGTTRIWVVGVVVIAVLIGWGKHFEVLSRFLFNYVPLYDKFRVPSMSIVILCIAIPFMGFLGIQRFIELVKENEEYAKKKLFLALYITGGTALFIALFGPGLFSMDGANDTRMLAFFEQNNLPVTIDDIMDQRASLMRDSAWRSLGFVAAAFGLLWLLLKNKVNLSRLAIALIALVTFDLWSYDKDHLGEDEFVESRNYLSQYNPTPADQLILKDSDPHYRVWNSTQGLTADSRTSYYHKSAGGYHGAKLSRYQNLIDHQLSQGNMAAFDMLNTKWIIAESRQQQGVQNAQINPNALGNAWFPKEVIWANGPNDEMSKLTNFDPATQVVVDQSYQSAVGQSVQNDSLNRNTIKLTQYDPKELRYSASVQGRQALAVFSEVWYKAPSQEWKLYVDGEEIELIRVNYLLRAGVIPQGEHEVVMRFEPDTYYVGEKINLAFSILLVLAVGGAITIEVRNRKKEEEEKQ